MYSAYRFLESILELALFNATIFERVILIKYLQGKERHHNSCLDHTNSEVKIAGLPKDCPTSVSVE